MTAATVAELQPDAPAVDAHRKRAATLIARAALGGIVVHELTADDGRPEWIATRWAMTRAFRDLDDFERWLDFVVGPL